MKKHTNMKIGVGSVVKAKVVQLEKITREGRSRSMRKDVVVCVHIVMLKNNFLYQFEDEHKKYIRYNLLCF